MAALYIHIPFCRSKCRYCDFYSETKLQLLEPFLQALRREIELSGPDWDHTFSTIYFGGGTPSLLPARQIAAILEQLERAFSFAPECEISLEANPGSTVRHLAGWRAAGIHRLTIGAQSFDDADLQFLGRRHTAAEALDAMRAARAAGFANLGIDLIYGLPGQFERWTSTLRTATLLQPEHISAYGLTWEHNTPLWRMLQRGEVQKCAEDEERDMFLIAMRMLAEAGYEQYEISNFCRPGFRSRHNSAYWDLTPFL
ncbi:radical SAM family heme chaperone HemW, partial [candidate division KSB1 bacterium]|nr:radical SAM family heme chaperone HemW [candidate division KSB1 bacterium]